MFYTFLEIRFNGIGTLSSSQAQIIMLRHSIREKTQRNATLSDRVHK